MGGGKSSSAGTTYDYFGTMACGIGIGPIGELVGIIMDGQAVWPQGKGPWAPGIQVNNGDLWVYDAQTWVAQQSFQVPANVQDTDPTVPGNNDAYWLEYTYAPTGEYDTFTITTSDGTTYGNVRLYWGSMTQTVDFFLQAANNSNGDNHPGYVGISYCIPIDFLLGQEVQAAPNLEFIMRRVPQQNVVVGAAATIVDGQSNLAAWMAEVLTSENGIGLASAQLDAISWNAVATYLQNNQALYGASPLVDTSDTLRSVCDQFAQMIDGYIRYNPATQLIELGVYQHGVQPAVYTTLTEDSLTERPQLKTQSWQNTYSRCTVRYNDRQLNFQETSLHADDPRAWAVLKGVRELSVDRPWITRGSQALLHGRETLRVVGHAQMTGTLSVRREIGRNIRGGDYVLLDVDIEPNQYTITQFFRVTKRTIPMTGPIKLEVFADNTLAAIPFQTAANPVNMGNTTVAPITSFRILEIPTVLSGIVGAITILAERSSDIQVGCQVYFDTATVGTFQSLGNFTGFAARGALVNACAATDATLKVSIDPTQVDADFFTQQFSANEAADDTMLAFIVQRLGDPGQPDDGQIAENNGYALVEICSVSTQTLIGGGSNLQDAGGNAIEDVGGNAIATPTQYQLAVLRGRQNTSAQAFPAGCEVWLIPRANVVGFTSTLFATLRNNRAAGIAPNYGYFRLCPYTFVAQLPLSTAANAAFHFPLKSVSAPTLALTTPNTFAINQAAASYPLQIPIKGVWTDPNGALVEIIVKLRKSTDTADRVVSDVTIAPTGSYNLATVIMVESAGSYTIKLLARDAQNLTSEVDIAATITGAGATCAVPAVLDSTGKQVLNPSGSAGTNYAGFLSLYPTQLVASGPLTLECSTPGATIFFQVYGVVLQNGQIVVSAQNQTFQYGPNCQPFLGIYDVGGNLNNPQQDIQEVVNIAIWATAPGYAQSPTLAVQIQVIYNPNIVQPGL